MVKLSISELHHKILITKELTYGKASKYLGINKGEIWRAINLHIFPRAEWKRQRLCLTTLSRDIPITKVGLCEVLGCDNEYIRWAYNRKYCDEHSRSIKRRR